MTSHRSVAGAIDALAAAIPAEPMLITGVLQGWRAGRSWNRCEIVCYDGPDVVARIVVAVPPSTRLDVPPGRLEGFEAILAGRFETHPLYGPVQFVATRIQATANEAQPSVATRECLARLESAGLLGRNRSLDLGLSPQRVGLIAPCGGGAGGADFLDRIRASGEKINVVARLVPMGGPAASREIPAAIVELCADAVDAIVICRGGGSSSDLAAFNHPAVIESVCTATRPVIVAVGHATDATVADSVAHTSLPTPSSAAAWLIDRRRSAGRQAAMARAAQQSAAAAVVRSLALDTERAAVELSERARRQTARARGVLIGAAVVVAMALLAIVYGLIV